MPRRSPWRRVGATVVIATLGVLSLGRAEPAAAEAVAPSLAGEYLSAVGTPTIVSNCSDTGESTMTFRAEGPAVGPYPGTYTESGVITFGEPAPLPGSIFPGRAVTKVAITFRIDSAVGVVTGTKSLVLPGQPANNACTDYRQPVPGMDDFCQFINPSQPPNTNTGEFLATTQVLTDYEATIVPTTGGFYRDSGQTRVGATDQNIFCRVGGYGTRGFEEQFMASDGVVALSTTGKATGGGQLALHDVTFGFVVNSTENGLDGRCTVVDPDANVKIKCLTVTTYVESPTSAYFAGTAEVNGQVTGYRIEIDDLSEPNMGADTFKIVTDTGYSTGGPVTAGNIQIHKDGGQTLGL